MYPGVEGVENVIKMEKVKKRGLVFWLTIFRELKTIPCKILQQIRFWSSTKGENEKKKGQRRS